MKTREKARAVGGGVGGGGGDGGDGGDGGGGGGGGDGGDGGGDGGGEIHGRTSEGSGHASEPVVSENESEAMVKRVPLGAQVLLLESQ